METITESSGNVFADLGFSPEESVLLAMRAELMARLRETIAERGWTQTEAASRLGIAPLILGDAIEGEAREVGKALAGMALSCGRHGFPAEKPCVLLSGGETTVTLKGGGRGGRNTECLLGLALALDGAPDIHALAADTDGIDGSEDNAGAFVAPETLARARTLAVDPRQRLADNDAWGFFAALDDLLVTGPTRTNVNDFRAVLVGLE